jgi:hypothetical protein
VVPRGRHQPQGNPSNVGTCYRDGDDGLVDEPDGLIELLPVDPVPVVAAVFGLHLSVPVLAASQAAMVAYVQVFWPALFSRQNAAFCDAPADGEVDGLVEVPSAKAPPVSPIIAIAAPRVVIRIVFPPCESSPLSKPLRRTHSSAWNSLE